MSEAGAGPPTRGKRRHRVLRYLLATIAVLVGIELVTRWLVPEPTLGILARRPLLTLYPGLDHPEQVFTALDHSGLQWAPYEHWVARPNLRTRFFRTNALGFRGPETPIEKPAGRFRIVVLGGSAAWGVGCTADERTVPGQLQTVLRSRYPGRNIEVINGAQAGFVSGQELIYYHRTVAPLAPDLVLLLDGYNDVEADFGNPEPGLPQNAAQLRTRYQDFLSSGRLGQDLARFLRGSRFLDVMSRWIGGGGAKGPWVPAVEPSATAEAYVRNVTALARLAAPSPVHVALQPVPAVIRKPLAPEEVRILAEKERTIQGYAERVRAAYRAMEDGVRRAGLPLIRLDDALGAEPRLLFADECHFADDGARLVAAAIAAHWIERGVLER